MTDVQDRTAISAPGSLWRPFTDEPLLTPAMALGWDATDPADRERLTRYLAAFVAARSGPVHINVAFNAVYFGYDLITGGYVGGLDLFSFPQVSFGETTDALPVGALVNIAAGEQPVFAEVVYKEGAHPDLQADGEVPPWLSGAPAGATGPATAEAPPGGPVLRERLVVDVDAFGQDFSLTRKQLDRLRQRGRWLDADGHLLLDARYASRRDADLDETAYYARYLLTRGREQFLSAAATLPLTTVLSADAGEEQLAAALNGMLGSVAAALADIPLLRMWRGYAFTRASLGTRLLATGPLGESDLTSLATGLHRAAVPLRRGRWAPQHCVAYTAVGPRLRTVRDAGPQLVGVGYATAVCHANAVISDYAHREVDEDTGLLSDQVHLRLDDPWQGGGVWRAERPGSRYVHVDVAEPLGLGWSSTLPEALPDVPASGSVATPEESEASEDTAPQVGTEAPQQDQPAADVPETALPEPEPEDAGGLDDLIVTDSQISWTQALRLTHLLEGRLPLPDLISAPMRDAGLAGVRLRLQLTHDGYTLEPAEATQAVDADLFGRTQLTDVEWPLDWFAGIVLICTWPRGAGVIRATTTLLDIPVTIDGELIEHRYDPRILTRDGAPGQPRRGGGDGGGTLTLAQRVLRAVRRRGYLDPDGQAVLARSSLPAVVYGTADAAAAEELEVAVAELVAAGQLCTDVGSVDARRWLHYPAEPGQPPVPLVIYQPRTVAGPPRAAGAARPGGALEPRFLQLTPVAGHLRRIGQLGWEAGQEARAAYREDRARFQLFGPLELPDGYTYVRPFTRGGG